MEIFYICFEHTTYWFEFHNMFGPFFYRVEGNKLIDIEFEFDENNNYECTSNKFLWDFFGEWYEARKQGE